MNTFQNAAGKPVLLEIVKAIQDNKGYLGEVDGLIGDGDHGMNMSKGFRLFEERFGHKDFGFSEGLYELGVILLNEIGGSMGPIYGTFFMEAADSLENKESIGVKELKNMLEASLHGIYEIVDARPGDKTLVDTLAPAVESLEESDNRGMDLEEALSAMKRAAKKGMESTKDLLARYGRSSRLGERSKGVLDAGAVSCNIILEALANGIIEIRSGGKNEISNRL